MKRTSRIAKIAIGILGTFIICCTGILIIAILMEGSGNPIPTAPPPMPVDQIIAGTANAAQTQTSQALPPSPIPTQTIFQSGIPPTSTVFIFDLQTNIAATSLRELFETPTPLPLDTVPPDQPLDAVCSCSGDTLNCSDFSSHSAAQTCYNYCIAQGKGDIHNLDRDNNGSACESLP